MSKHRSSNADTIILETCPKKAADTAAWTGLENAKAKSSVTNVGPSSRICTFEDSAADVVESGGLLLGWGDFVDAG
ncbi:hypothetical protein NM688_g1000 [Phlebia brevispora]|uniref:Uncharacterized protein n=1 Tax=Phlebia brevispora TaxID=194682 RepID=A0ACC1TCQ8_9APHY|nr:hypothetical protein NM688_g1000 [Phlebia brevispora]